MSQRRAKTGGEVGANGEWYPGGKWIATTTRAKSYRPVRPTGRQLIAPGVWAQPPTATSVALLGQLGVGAWTVLVNGRAADRAWTLADGDVVEVLPPFAGG